MNIQANITIQSTHIMSFPVLLNNIPFVHLYSQKLIKDYQKISKQMRQGDILAISQINILKEKIKKMINKISSFYNLHYADSRVSYLYSIQADLNSVLTNQQTETFIRSINQSQSGYFNKVKVQNGNQYIKKELNSANYLNKQPFIRIEQQNDNLGTAKSTNIKQNNKYQNYPLKSMKNSYQKKNDKISQTLKNERIGQKKQKKNSLYNQNFQYKNQVGNSEQTVLKYQFSRSPIQKYQKQKANLFIGNNNTKQASQKKIRTSKKTQNYLPKKQIYSESKGNVSVFNQIQVKGQATQNWAQKQKRSFQQDQQKKESKRKTSIQQSQQKRQIYKLQKESGLSSIKNLANLIFTIKMTRQEYNDFMKIKIQNQKK